MTGGTSIRQQQSFIDAAGRSQIAQATSTGDYNLSRDELPLYFDNEEISGASGAYDTVDNGWKMDVSANGDRAIFQTKQRHPYFVGNAQEAETTQINFQPEAGVQKRVGYFSSSTTSPYDANLDGAFLESKDTTVKLYIFRNGLQLHEGQDISGLTDWSKFNVSLKSFLYLGGTSLTDYYVKNGGFEKSGKYIHAGVVDTVIMNSPAQPIRAEIESTGGVGSLTFVCGRAVTSGIVNQTFGTPIYYDSGAAVNVAPSVERVMLALRKNDRTAEFFPNFVNVASDDANSLFYWKVRINPTLSAPMTYAPIANTYLDGARDDGINVTGGGHIIAQGAAAGRASIAGQISIALRIGETIAGVFDELVLTHENISGGTETVIASVGGTVV